MNTKDDINKSESLKAIQQLHDLNIKGKGVKVAVIESGAAKGNKNLNIIQVINPIDGNVKYSDHTTSCASIIGSKEFGIASDCELYSVCSNNSDVTKESASRIAQCINWCVKNNIDVISISMGFLDIESSELRDACKNADEMGIIIVAAAGNNGSKDADWSYIPVPASYSSTICVSNIDYNTNKIADSSSEGWGIDFAGYGDNSKAYNSNGDTITFTGTSAACPYVAGCIALIKQQLPELNRLEVYDILKNNVVKIDDKVKSPQYGYGLVKPVVINENYAYRKREILEYEFLEKNIYFEDNKVDVEIGKNTTPNLIFLPNNDITSYVDFISSNEECSNVASQRNIIIGNEEGNSTITAILDNNKVAQLQVNVIKPKDSAGSGNSSDNNKNELLKSLGVYDVWNKGFKGQGIKVGYIGFGCIDTDKIKIKQRYALNKVDKLECYNGIGTQTSSLITGTGVGTAINCDYYCINSCWMSNGATRWDDNTLCAEWAIQNKLDIVFVRSMEDTSKGENSSWIHARPSYVKNVIKKMHDNNIIIVSIIDDDGMANPALSTIATEDTLTISYVDSNKQIAPKAPLKPAESNWVDCVSYGYGMSVIDQYNKEKVLLSSDVQIAQLAEFHAAAQICGILALLKQQNPNLKTAQDIRKILPNVCEPLYGGKNTKTGYGLLKAKIL